MSPVPDMCDRVTRWGFVTLIVFFATIALTVTLSIKIP